MGSNDSLIRLALALGKGVGKAFTIFTWAICQLAGPLITPYQVTPSFLKADDPNKVLGFSFAKNSKHQSVCTVPSIEIEVVPEEVCD